MDSYIEILKNILKNNIDGFYDDIIKIYYLKYLMIIIQIEIK